MSDTRISLELAAVARRQHQQVTLAQLRGIGLGRDAITHRASHGMIFRIHRGVFSLVAPPLAPLQRASAAVLACGPDGALGDGSALALWWPGQPWPDIPTVVGTARRAQPGIRVRQVRGLTRADLRVHHGIRITSPARTLLDCARELGYRATARLLAEGRRAGLIHPASLDDVLTRFPRHRGHTALVAVRDDPAARARSDWETAFPAFCARHGLPEPLVNARVLGRERDAYFPDQGLIVELDSWAFHQDRISFEDDRERDVEALAAGLGTYRLTWARFTGSPDREARRLARVLATRGWSPAARSGPGP